MDERWPVVVVGAGPVGLTAALLLARRGVRTLVLDRHPHAYPLPRAVHLDGEVARILEEVGLSSAFRTISRPMPGLRLVDRHNRRLAEFRRDPAIGPSTHPASSLFHQPDLDALLESALRPPAELRRGVAVAGVHTQGCGAVVRCADGTAIEADAVLGCDGADSMVRSTLGTRVHDLRPGERWLVLDASVARRLPAWDGVHQVCDARRPATFMRVTGSDYRW